MRKLEHVTKKCPKCGKLYQLGYNGVVGGCDTCMGVERDKDGYAWMPGEASIDFIPAGAPLDTPDITTIRREDAMKGKK